MARLRDLRQGLYSSHRVCHSGIGSEWQILNKDAPGRSPIMAEQTAREMRYSGICRWMCWRGQSNPGAHLKEPCHVDESTR